MYNSIIVTKSWSNNNLIKHLINMCNNNHNCNIIVSLILAINKATWSNSHFFMFALLRRTSFWPPSMVIMVSVIILHILQIKIFHMLDLCGQLSCIASTPVFSDLWVLVISFLFRINNSLPCRDSIPQPPWYQSNVLPIKLSWLDKVAHIVYPLAVSKNICINPFWI